MRPAARIAIAEVDRPPTVQLHLSAAAPERPPSTSDSNAAWTPPERPPEHGRLNTAD